MQRQKGSKQVARWVETQKVDTKIRPERGSSLSRVLDFLAVCNSTCESANHCLARPERSQTVTKSWPNRDQIVIKS
eukprot:2776454-Rhodomonas_salina.1